MHWRTKEIHMIHVTEKSASLGWPGTESAISPRHACTGNEASVTKKLNF